MTRLARALLVLVLLLMAWAQTHSAEVAEARRSILVLGDSLAAGSGVGPDAAYPKFLQDRIDQEKLPYHVVNAGVSGDSSAGGVRRINWLLRQKVDVLLLELGGNDGLRGLAPEATHSNLIEIIQRTRSKYPQVQVVVAGMQMPANMGADYVKKFKTIFPEVAQETHATLIPFLLEGIGADPKYNQEDLIHPTREGHQIVAETVWKVLGPLLRTEASPGSR